MVVALRDSMEFKESVPKAKSSELVKCIKRTSDSINVMNVVFR